MNWANGNWNEWIELDKCRQGIEWMGIKLTWYKNQIKQQLKMKLNRQQLNWMNKEIELKRDRLNWLDIESELI